MQKESPDKITQWMERQGQSSEMPALSVVIPAFNEQWRLPPTLIDLIDFFDKRASSYELLVVDDGSRDLTSEIVQKFEKIRSQVRLIRLPRNYGKGHAVKLGALNAKGSRVLFVDADGATPIEELPRLEAALDEGSEIAIGSRALRSNDTKVKTRWYRKYLGRVFNLCVNLIILPKYADTQCGFKLFTARSAKFLFSRQRCDGFSFDVEILYLAERAGIPVSEVPVNWSNVPGSKVNLVLDSLKMFRDIILFKVWHRAVSPVDYSAAKL